MTLQILQRRLAEVPFDPRYVATNVDEVAVVATDVELRVDVSSYREEARELQNDLDEANATIQKLEGDLTDAEEERAKLCIELGGTKADLARHATCVMAFLEQLKPTLDPKSFEAARLAEIMHKIRG